MGPRPWDWRPAFTAAWRHATKVSASGTDHYFNLAVLGIVRDDFNKSTLSKIYRNMARSYHPDRIKDEVSLVRMPSVEFEGSE